MTSRLSLLLVASALLASGGVACKKSSGSSAPPPVPPLTMTAVAPTSGSNAGGTAITVTGADFASGATVEVGGAPATSVVFVDPNTLTGVAPAGAVGPADVRVVNPDGRAGTLPGAFLYVGPNPTLTSVSPGSGTTAGGTTVNITGTNFFAGATVTIGGAAATVTSVSATVIAATTGAGPIGPQNVVVTNLDGNAATGANAFTYLGPTPTVTGCNPTGASNAGGSTVTIVGTNFAGGATVTIGGAAAAVSTVSATQIVVTTPTLSTVAGPQVIVVTNVDGQSATLAGGFNAVGPNPTISTPLNPTSGTTGGGTLVTITGTNFFAGATVSFGGAAGTSVTVGSSTQITVFTPASGSTGAVNVVVANADGNSATATGAYTYVTGPSISAVNPAVGTNAGGTTITITGNNFAAGSATVRIGGAAATGVTSTLTQIVCTTPAGAVGPANVTVTNPGPSPTTLVGGFTYQGGTPTISAVAPGSGPNAGGTTITITGTNYYAGATVTVGGATASVSSVAATQIVVVTPNVAPAIGPQNVVVTNLDGKTVTGTGAFNAQGPAPTVSSVTPSTATNAGGTAVTIAGTNFVTGATVSVGGQVAGSVTVVNANQITCTTPNLAPAIGPQAVVVTNIDGRSGTLAGGFNAQGPLPTVTGVNPTQGTNTGGTPITITGTNFAAGATVTLGGTAASVSSVSATQIVATTANVSPTQGVVGVVVTNIDGRSGTLASGWTWLGPAPTLSGVSPASGTNAGGNTITLTGTNLVTGATVTVGGAAAGSVSVSGGTTCTCTVPALTSLAGPVNIVLTNPDTQQVTLTGQYTLLGPTPTFSAINAAQGPNGGGTTVTITGTNLLTGATVTIGGQSATAVTVTPTAQIVCTTPSVAPNLGPQSVVITNGDGKSVTAAGAFNAVAATPTVTGINPTSGPRTGGTTVTITGTNFFGGATATIGGVALGSCDVLSATSLRGVTLNDGSLGGQQNVVVTNVDGQSATLTNGFTLTGTATPTLTVISPTAGAQAGGTTVAINGTNFASGATVQFVDPSGPTAVSATVQSITPGTILVTTGAMTGTPPITVDVVVTNPGPTSVTLTGSFQYLATQPVITGVSPATGSNLGGYTITLTGTGFQTGASVYVEGFAQLGSVTVSGGGTQITGTVPSGTGNNIYPGTGALRLLVRNPDKLFDTTRAFLFQGSTPTVTGVSPNTGSVGGGTFVTVTGTNFVPGATVEFGGVKATYVDVPVFNGTTLTCYTPAGAATGSVTVKVTNDDTLSGQQSSAFAYAAGPVITSVSPNNGAVSGGTTITITGTGFATGDTVALEGVVPPLGASSGTPPPSVAATSITIVSATQITCVTPGFTVYGWAAVRVTPSSGPDTARMDAFLYRNGVDAQTAPYTWDTSPGIDCTQRWYVNLNEAATLKDLQNRACQSWGTPGDSTRPPANLPLVDQFALDWMRAYVLRTANVIYGRNPDGTKISGKSINITFCGLQPTTGRPAPWVCQPGDYSVITCGGCNSSAAYKASQTGSGCSGGVIGTAPYDNAGSGPCNNTAEHVSNSTYHNCSGCGTGLGIFASNIGNAWGQSLSPRLSASDQQYLDGTTNAGTRYNQIHEFLQQFARRIAFVACHEMGHSLGLAADGTVGRCPRSTGQCSATPAHTACCGGNLMAPSISLSGFSSTDYYRGFGGNPDPGNPAKGASCGQPTTSWAVLQAYLGLSP